MRACHRARKQWEGSAACAARDALDGSAQLISLKRHCRGAGNCVATLLHVTDRLHCHCTWNFVRGQARNPEQLHADQGPHHGRGVRLELRDRARAARAGRTAARSRPRWWPP